MSMNVSEWKSMVSERYQERTGELADWDADWFLHTYLGDMCASDDDLRFVLGALPEGELVSSRVVELLGADEMSDSSALALAEAVSSRVFEYAALPRPAVLPSVARSVPRDASSLLEDISSYWYEAVQRSPHLGPFLELVYPSLHPLLWADNAAVWYALTPWLQAADVLAHEQDVLSQYAGIARARCGLFRTQDGVVLYRRPTPKY